MASSLPNPEQLELLEELRGTEEDLKILKEHRAKLLALLADIDEVTYPSPFTGELVKAKTIRRKRQVVNLFILADMAPALYRQVTVAKLDSNKFKEAQAAGQVPQSVLDKAVFEQEDTAFITFTELHDQDEEDQ